MKDKNAAGTRGLQQCTIVALVAMLSILSMRGMQCYAQATKKSPVGKADYMLWSDVMLEKISEDGKWVSYSLRNENADTTVVRSVDSNKQFKLPQASNGIFLGLLYLYYEASGQVDILNLEKGMPIALPGSTGYHVLGNSGVANEDFAVAILFLMEVTHSKSIVSMPGVFSVILESFANIIINPQQVISQLITNSVTGKHLMEDLNSVLDMHAALIQPAALEKIRRRLPSLIRPINPHRLTNFEKLREPFDQLGIRLSPADEAAIEHRNSLLHGNILMNEGQARSSKEIDNHMLYITAKLYTLISKLILKKCGYNGYVINQAKFYDYPHADNEPEFFELI